MGNVEIICLYFFEQQLEASTRASDPRFDVKRTELLRRNIDFVDKNGDLLRERIKDSVSAFDRAFVSLLLSKETIVKPFFDEVSGSAGKSCHAASL